ncbi:Asp23/Gls24 family envelope stress response protein [Streptomyces marincola]|uniref:Asp23/Gls24 family envelope stress response protein n=1 Tax=Streptomyces marincola TaxID=2878388 RepID=A0A1W7CS35_9ACTN|nr:Asp23/Gls24 family envelope stress response protein [Streptomyces marincola]ARQ67557.1 Asp23/Gls24 family envelope stress response protein [Streptomyces marincola]
MTTTTAAQAQAPAGTSPRPAAEAPQGGTTVSAGASGPQEPAATRGRTVIADGVVEKIAGMAAREVSGVHALGGGLVRALGAVRDRVPGGRANAARGVRAEVGQRQTAIDLDIVIEYGESVPDVSAAIRENVVAALERTTGLEVIEVNISVGDVHLPEDDEPEESRVA